MLKKAPPVDAYVDEPPQPLGPIGRSLWDAYLGDHDLPDERQRRLLFTACTAAQRAADLGSIIERDGPVIESKTGHMREHPAVRPELHYLALAESCFALLKPSGGGSPGRPPGPGRWYDGDD